MAPTANSDAVWGEAEAGLRKVLAGHAPLIALLQDGDVLIEKEDSTTEKLPVAGGVLHVKEDRVTLLVNF